MYAPLIDSPLIDSPLIDGPDSIIISSSTIRKYHREMVEKFSNKECDRILKEEVQSMQKNTYKEHIFAKLRSLVKYRPDLIGITPPILAEWRVTDGHTQFILKRRVK